MTRIRVEITNLAALFKPLAPVDKNAVLVLLASAARAYWVKLANDELHSTRADYVHGIQPIELEDGAASIALLGKVPNMVENGMDPFDMHEGLLAEKGHDAADGGRYLAVPFRHKTPGSTSQGGTPMGGAFDPPGAKSRRLIPPNINSLQLGQRIYKDAKRLKLGQSLKAGLAPKLSSKHSTDIYAGMRRVLQATAGGKNQATYMTWRMIAVGPDGNPRPEGKWRHPGIESRNLAERVREYVETIAADTVAAYFAARNAS